MGRHLFQKKRFNVGQMMGPLFFAGCLGLVSSLGWAASPDRSLPPEQLLQYTLNELKATMEQSSVDNVRLSDRNRALRDRIVVMKEKAADLEGRKKRLLSQYEDLSTRSGIKDQEVAALEEQVQHLLDLQAGSKKERESLQAKVEEARKRNQVAADKVPLLRQEIQGLIRQQKESSQQRRQNDRTDGKRRLQQQWKEKEAALKKIESAVLRLETAVDQGLLVKKGFLNQSDLLKEELAQLHQRGTESLPAEGPQQSGPLAQTRKAVQDLQTQKDLLTRAVTEVEQQQDLLRSSSGKETVRLQQMQRALAAEKKMLGNKIALSKEPSSLRQDATGAQSRNAPAAVPTGNEDLSQKISAQKERQAVLQKEYASLSQELPDLAQQAQQQRRLVGKGESPVLQEEKRRIAALLDGVITEQEQVLADGPEEMPDPGHFQKTIDDLRLRESVLTSSLSIIEERFKEEKTVADNFSREQVQLQEYLDMVSRENRSLQEKVSTLNKEIEQPQTEEKSSVDP